MVVTCWWRWLMSTTTKSIAETTGAEDVAVNLATRAGTLISGVAIQSLLAYALLPAGRGEFAVCILFAGLLGVLLTPGADAGAQYFVMAREISVSQGVSVSLLICLLGTGLATALAIPLINGDISFFRKADPGSFYLSLVLLPLITFSSAVQHQLAGLRRFMRLGLFSFVQTVANGLALVCFVVGLRLGVNGAILAACVGNVVMIIVCLRDLGRNAGFKCEIPSRSGLTQILRYGLKYYIARIGWGIDVRVGTLLLSMLASRAEVGIFAVASALMMSFMMISNAVSVALLPRTARDESGLPDLVVFCARIMTWVTGVALILLLAFDIPLVRILLSARFLPSVQLIRIIAPGILVYAGASVFATYFRGINRPDICSWVAGCGLGLTVSVVLLLYRDFGVAASAWGMTVGLFGRSALLSVIYYRMTRTSPSLGWLPQRGDIPRLRSLALSAINRVRRRSSVYE